MASKLFFNGRILSTPSTVSIIDDSAEQPTSLTVGNVLAIIGDCAGGQPNTAMSFGDPNQVAATLVSGPLLTAVQKAFAPSDQTGGPSEVIAIRPGTATPSTLLLLDAFGAASIVLTSSQYGLPANAVNVRIEAGSVSGKAVTTQTGQSYNAGDNLGRNACSVSYTGTQPTGLLQVTPTQVLLFAPALTNVGTINLVECPTVAQLADRINAVAGFSCTVVGGSENTPSLLGLDTNLVQDVRTAPVMVTANLQAIIEWLNGAGDIYVTAARSVGATQPPANLATTFLQGGTAPALTMADWMNALNALQTQDVQHIVPLTGNPAVHAAASAHVQYMSTVGRKERRSYVGPVAGTSLAAVMALPLALDDDRTALCWPGYYDFDVNGNLVLLDPFYTAVLVAAGFAGSSPGTPMTNKTLTVRGLEVAVRNPTDTDPLIQSGVLTIEKTPQGYKVVRSISTWLANDNFNRCEVSVGIATDFVARNVRDAVDPIRGQEATPIAIARAVSQAQSALMALALPAPAGPGVIVGDANNPAFRNIVGTLTGDQLAVSFECSPVIPVNFIPVTIAIVPYSGSATAA